CPNCNAKLPEGSKFCDMCGTRLGAIQQDQTLTQPQMTQPQQQRPQMQQPTTPPPPRQQSLSSQPQRLSPPRTQQSPPRNGQEFHSKPKSKTPVALIVTLSIVGVIAVLGTIVFLVISGIKQNIEDELAKNRMEELRMEAEEVEKAAKDTRNEQEEQKPHADELSDNDESDDIKQIDEDDKEVKFSRKDDADEYDADDTNEDGKISEDEKISDEADDELSYEDIAALCAKHCGAMYARIDSVNDDGTIVVQVYDEVDGHTTTFDWYTVNTETLDAVTEFGFEFNLNDDR
ncbi:MAG: zinc-ribbon domain-containing protein, partial [Lachnospiraceae bacterium]|nr:zinc-ribbon domain-containing protein [Lachnospiraceae bacterium]